jgi:hypothetical protein
MPEKKVVNKPAVIKELPIEMAVSNSNTSKPTTLQLSRSNSNQPLTLATVQGKARQTIRQG